MGKKKQQSFPAFSPSISQAQKIISGSRACETPEMNKKNVVATRSLNLVKKTKSPKVSDTKHGGTIQGGPPTTVINGVMGPL